MIADLVAFLGQQSEITSIVSSRVYPQVLPQDSTLPALTFNQVSAVRAYVLAGDAGKARRRIQINCWGETEKAVVQLADAVRQALSGFFGSMQGTAVHCVVLDNELDLFESEPGVTGTYRVAQDYIISHLEA